jgi:hypothetical protein
MSIFRIFRSEMARLMLAGFAVGTIAVGATVDTGAIAAPVPHVEAGR